MRVKVIENDETVDVGFIRIEAKKLIVKVKEMYASLFEPPEKMSAEKAMKYFIERFRFSSRVFLCNEDEDEEDYKSIEECLTCKGFEEAKPYANEHACRLHDPEDYDEVRRKNDERKHDGKFYHVIYGKRKSDGIWEDQAFRYSKDVWTVTQAKAHCSSHSGIEFEPAEGE